MVLRALTISLATLLPPALIAQQPAPIVPGHLILVLRDTASPEAALADLHRVPGAESAHRLANTSLATLIVDPASEVSLASSLRLHPAVSYVLHDHLVRAHAAQQALPRRAAPIDIPKPPPPPLFAVHVSAPIFFNAPVADGLFASPLGWAVQTTGAFGNNIPGGPAVGPWNISMGAGVRIAVIDSGVDPTHPDIEPHLASATTVTNLAQLGTPCDDGSPADQSGHGTWVASLATGAYGPTTGPMLGVAPQATLLSIKALVRVPSAVGADVQARCANGEPQGLLSWIVTAIHSATDAHVDIINLSLGALIDTSTAEGAGWQAVFDQATSAATAQGILVVAALGNDGQNLDASSLRELPAQASGVLGVAASTNPQCAENNAPHAVCTAGPVTLASYSNRAGKNTIAAPGGNLPWAGTLATPGVTGAIAGACSRGLPHTQDGLPANGASFGCFASGHTDTVQQTGTSASSALVAGAAALLRAAHPNWTPAQLITAITTTATPLHSSSVPQLNLAAALDAQP